MRSGLVLGQGDEEEQSLSAVLESLMPQDPTRFWGQKTFG